MSDKPAVIPSDAILRKLIEAGALPPDCRRVVIELEAGAPARVVFDSDDRLAAAAVMIHGERKALG